MCFKPVSARLPHQLPALQPDLRHDAFPLPVVFYILTSSAAASIRSSSCTCRISFDFNVVPALKRYLPDHRNLDNIRCRSLNWGVHSNSLTKRTLHKIAMLVPGQVCVCQTCALHSLFSFASVTSWSRNILIPDRFQSSFSDITLASFGVYTQILTQSKGTDTIHDTKVYRFCISSLEDLLLLPAVYGIPGKL